MVCASETFKHNLSLKFITVWICNTQYSILTVIFRQHVTYDMSDNTVVLKLPAVRPQKVVICDYMQTAV